MKLTLEELHVIEDHLGQLDQQMANLLAAHHDAVQRLGWVVERAPQRGAAWFSGLERTILSLDQHPKRTG